MFNQFIDQKGREKLKSTGAFPFKSAFEFVTFEYLQTNQSPKLFTEFHFTNVVYLSDN